MIRFQDLIVTKWGARYRGSVLPCAIGRGGIGQKQGEGDGITPVGNFEISEVQYRSDRLDFEAPNILQKPIGLMDVWSDDPKDPDYNHGVSAFDHPFSHEKLRRADGLYDAFGVLDFNWPIATTGAGSAIFIHAWRKPRHPTEGCIAFNRSDLIWIFQSWEKNARVVIRG